MSLAVDPLAGLRWQADDPLAGWTLHANPAYDQRSWRWRNDDGNESAATWIAGLNTAIQDVPVGVNIRLRFEVQETGGGGQNNRTITLQYRINGAGDWLTINDTSFGVILAASPNVTQGTSTTNQLTAGTGTFRPGIVCTTVSGSDVSFQGNDHTEMEWSFQLVEGELSDGDTVSFRVLVQGAVTDTSSAGDAVLTVSADDPPAPVDEVSGPLGVAVGLSGAVESPAASVPTLSGPLDVRVGLSGSVAAPAETVPTLSGTLPVGVSAAGVLDVPAATVPQLAGSLGVAVDLAGALDVPTASVPTVTGPLPVGVDLTGSVSVPAADVPDVAATLPVSVSLDGTVDTPTASVPTLVGDLPVGLSLDGTVADPGVVVVPTLAASLDVGVGLDSILAVPTASIPTLIGTLDLGIGLAGTVADPGVVVVPTLTATLTVGVVASGVLDIPTATVDTLSAILPVGVGLSGLVTQPGQVPFGPGRQRPGKGRAHYNRGPQSSYVPSGGTAAYLVS